MDWALYKDNLSRFGFIKTSYTVLYASINKLFFYKVLQGMTITMDSLDLEYLQKDDRLDCEFLSLEALLNFASDETLEMTESFIRDAIDRGDFCFGILDDGELASYGWYSRIPTPVSEELELHFDKAWTYMYKGYTRGSHRGQRLHAIGMALALQAFTEMGARGLISYVETPNYRSLRSCARMGYRNFGKILIAKPFGRFFIRPQKECAPYGFTVKPLGQAAAPSEYPGKQGY